MRYLSAVFIAILLCFQASSQSSTERPNSYSYVSNMGVSKVTFDEQRPAMFIGHTGSGIEICSDAYYHCWIVGSHTIAAPKSKVEILSNESSIDVKWLGTTSFAWNNCTLEANVYFTDTGGNKAIIYYEEKFGVLGFYFHSGINTPIIELLDRLYLAENIGIFGKFVSE